MTRPPPIPGTTTPTVRLHLAAIGWARRGYLHEWRTTGQLSAALYAAACVVCWPILAAMAVTRPWWPHTRFYTTTEGAAILGVRARPDGEWRVIDHVAHTVGAGQGARLRHQLAAPLLAACAAAGGHPGWATRVHGLAAAYHADLNQP